MYDWDRRAFLTTLGATLGATAFPLGSAQGASWPSRPITAVIGYRPGGGTDFVSRAMAPLLEAEIKGAQVKTVNQPGASASIATEFVWTKPSDGHWWLMTSGFNRGLRVSKLHSTVPYLDWQYYQADTAIMSIAVKPDSPVKDFGDFMARCKKNPKGLKVSNSGTGGSWHLGGTLMRTIGKFDYVDVPYKGGKPAVLAALNGEVDVVTSGFHEHLQHLKAGRLRSLAVCSTDDFSIQGLDVKTVNNWIPGLKSHTPFGGGSTMGMKRDTDPGILRAVGKAWLAAAGGAKFGALEAKAPRFPEPTIGAAADKKAALWETIAANLLHKAGKSKVDPKSLGIPSIEEFENFWPPKGYKPVI